MAKQTISLRIDTDLLVAIEERVQSLGYADRTAYLLAMIERDLDCNTAVLQRNTEQVERNTDSQNRITEVIETLAARLAAVEEELGKDLGPVSSPA